MKKMMIALVTALAMVFLTACETKQQTGTLLGGAAGAAIGSGVGDSTTATVLGAIGGALLGREVGKRMDSKDREKLASTLERQETGETATWVDPDTGEKIAVTPTDTFQQDGRPCRNFTMDVEGVSDSVEGVACRGADGNWQIVG